MIYLASPYSHDDPAIRQQRYEAACVATAHLIKQGFPVISPIVHSHVLHAELGCGGDWETWAAIDRQLIDASIELWVLMLDGWEMSKGVAAEIDYADELGTSVSMLDPSRVGVTFDAVVAR